MVLQGACCIDGADLAVIDAARRALGVQGTPSAFSAQNSWGPCNVAAAAAAAGVL
jgi:hypothetical protein